MGTSHKATGEQPDYLSYLLRLWRVSDDGKPVWRALLKSSHTGQQVGFGSMEVLFEFLRDQTCLPPAAREETPKNEECDLKPDAERR
jgi:hypothetical protein